MSLTRKLLMLGCLLMPIVAGAHSWHEEAPPLTGGDVADVLAAIQATQISVAVPPDPFNSLDFLTLIALEHDDHHNRATRVLFMFEAIRQGAITSGEFTGDGRAFEWFDLVNLRDFDAVSAQFSQLEEWLSQQLTKAAQ